MDAVDIAVTIVTKMIDNGCIKPRGANSKEITDNYVEDVCTAYRTVLEAALHPSTESSR